MNNGHNKRSFISHLKVIGAFIALMALASPTFAESKRIRCVLDSIDVAKGVDFDTAIEQLNFTINFDRAREITCLAYLVDYSRGDFNGLPPASQKAGDLISEAVHTHPAFAEYREADCPRRAPHRPRVGFQLREFGSYDVYDDEGRYSHTKFYDVDDISRCLGKF